MKKLFLLLSLLVLALGCAQDKEYPDMYITPTPVPGDKLALTSLNDVEVGDASLMFSFVKWVKPNTSVVVDTTVSKEDTRLMADAVRQVIEEVVREKPAGYRLLIRVESRAPAADDVAADGKRIFRVGSVDRVPQESRAFQAGGAPYSVAVYNRYLQEMLEQTIQSNYELNKKQYKLVLAVYDYERYMTQRDQVDKAFDAPGRTSLAYANGGPLLVFRGWNVTL